MRYGILLACGVAALTGCSKSDSNGGGTPPPLAARTIITPDDLMTGVATTPITVTFNGSPDDMSVEAVRQALKLTTYPEGVPVGFSAVSVNHSMYGPMSDSSSAPTQKVIQVTPQSALAARWYAVSIPTLPLSIAAGNTVDNPTPGTVAQLSRFNPGSAPVIREVKLVQTTGRVELDFSEGVVIDPGSIAQHLQVSTVDGQSCPFAAIAGGGVRPYINAAFDCSQPALASGKISVRVMPGLTSASGVPLGIVRTSPCSSATVVSQTPWAAELDFAAAASCSTGCLELTPKQALACSP